MSSSSRSTGRSRVLALLTASTPVTAAYGGGYQFRLVTQTGDPTPGSLGVHSLGSGGPH